MTFLPWRQRILMREAIRRLQTGKPDNLLKERLGEFSLSVDGGVTGRRSV